MVVMALALVLAAGCGGSGNAGELARLRELAASGDADCRPAPDYARPQYIVGYGSFLQRASRTRTMPTVVTVLPIELRGFRRGFFFERQSPGFRTAFLGAVVDPSGSFNAVLFPVDEPDLVASDARESSYCRASVPRSDITVLSGTAPDPSSRIWIYVNPPDTIGLPSNDSPIVQSYVDIFLSGCLEIEEEYSLTGFADRCIDTTTDWSKHWVNDRIAPRRPVAEQPRANQIDTMLAARLPAEFAAIRIE